MKTRITDSNGYVHVAANSVGDYGESRGIFNSHDWWASVGETAEEFFKRMTGEEPVDVEEV